VKIDLEHERMMQDRLDGTASPAEVERLEAWLATNELGRTRMRELERLFSTLERVPAAEAPAGLREDVISALQARAGRIAPRRSSVAQRSWLGPQARLAYVFAAGLAAGAVVMGVVTGVIPPVAPGTGSGVSGSMIPARAPSASVERTVAAGDAQVKVIVWRAGSVRRLSLSLAGGVPAGIELTFDSGRLTAGSLRQGQPTAGIQIAPGRVLIQGQASGEFSLEFDDSGSSAPIHLELRAGGASAAAELPAPGVGDPR
jgi:anti-sigma factor RsiW